MKSFCMAELNLEQRTKKKKSVKMKENGTKKKMGDLYLQKVGECKQPDQRQAGLKKVALIS